MRRLEKFCGVQVVTYCLMENHFHLLVRVPCRQEMEQSAPLTQSRLRELLPLIYRGRELLDATQELERAESSTDSRWMREILARYSARRHSLSGFIKELKQRYTRWHNRRHNRVGTLWENRFRSVLVEGDETALLTIAAYIDLNPVRAGIVNDPKNYRWSGYAEAVAANGKNLAGAGLCSILRHTSFGKNRAMSWKNVAPRYRLLLFGHGEERDPDSLRSADGCNGMSRAQVQAELDRGGKLEVSEILRCRVRYLTDGAAIGSRAFLDQIFEENRGQFGKNRRRSGKAMRGSDWNGLQVLRDLQRQPFG